MTANRRISFAASALAIVAFSALGGCASVYRVDNQVESFSRWTDATTPSSVPAPPQTYRFERLPSRSTGAAAGSQEMIEQLAQEALAPLGWSMATGANAAPWTVEVTAQGLRLPRAPWEDPWDGGRFGWGGQMSIGLGHGGLWGGPWLMRPELPYYQRQVSLVIREATSGRVVFETSAAHDGRWNSTPGLWRAMISAALEGFPSPQKGTRQVNLDVPR